MSFVVALVVVGSLIFYGLCKWQSNRLFNHVIWLGRHPLPPRGYNSLNTDKSRILAYLLEFASGLVPLLVFTLLTVCLLIDFDQCSAFVDQNLAHLLGTYGFFFRFDQGQARVDEIISSILSLISTIACLVVFIRSFADD